MAYLRGTDGLARFLAAQGMPQEVASVKREHIESYIEDCLAVSRGHSQPAVQELAGILEMGN